MNYLQKSIINYIHLNVSNDETSNSLREEFKKLDFEDKKVLPEDQVKEIYKRHIKNFENQQQGKEFQKISLILKWFLCNLCS
jgi:hypothetical protein